VRLSDLVSALESADASVPLSVEVTGVAYDSRRVQPGNLFVAIGGFHVDGARFVSDAILRGAVAAVVSTATDIGVTESPAVRGKLIHVPDTRRALADLAAEWFGCPAERLYTIGITGTDGKTSTSYLTSAVLEAAALKTGLFSTVAYKVGSQWEPNKSRQTTPEALEVGAFEQAATAALLVQRVDRLARGLRRERLIAATLRPNFSTHLSRRDARISCCVL